MEWTKLVTHFINYILAIKTSAIFACVWLPIDMEQQIEFGESVTVAITEAVSALEDRPPDTLRPLHDVIRTDLDEIFAFDDTNRETSQLISLTFEYMDYHVTIEDDATLSIEPILEQPFPV